MGEFLFFEYLAGMLSNVHHDVLVSLVSAVFGAIFQLWCNMPIFTSFVKLPVYELIASAMYLSIQCFSTSGEALIIIVTYRHMQAHPSMFPIVAFLLPSEVVNRGHYGVHWSSLCLVHCCMDLHWLKL